MEDSKQHDAAPVKLKVPSRAGCLIPHREVFTFLSASTLLNSGGFASTHYHPHRKPAREVFILWSASSSMEDSKRNEVHPGSSFVLIESGYNPAELKDTSDPTEHLRQ